MKTRGDGLVLAVAALVVLGLKASFMNASAEQLRWLLAPTVAVTSWLTGFDFGWEGGVGYVNVGLHYSIATACAGLTFFAVACGALVSLLVTGRVGLLERVRWLVVALGLAYVTTVAANTVRLVLALELSRHHLGVPGLDAQNAHRLLGIVVYLGALVLLVEAVRGQLRLRAPLAVALAWYVGVTLLLPMLRGQPTGATFVTHAASISVVMLAVLALKAFTQSRASAAVGAEADSSPAHR